MSNAVKNDILSEALKSSGIMDISGNEDEKHETLNDTTCEQEVFFKQSNSTLDPDPDPYLLPNLDLLETTLPLHVNFGSTSNLFNDYLDQYGAGEAMAPEYSNYTRILKIHQGNVLKEMIAYFKDPQIIKENLSIKRFTGPSRPENGEGSGLLRDVFTEFWSEFYLECTNGCMYKVPILRHDFQEEEWEAVGRIILKGYLDVGYFPVGISPTIIEECLYGKFLSSLLECFFHYILQSEVKCIKEAFEDFTSADKEELDDILGSHQSHSISTAENIKPLILEIANKELVQDPRFVVDAWKNVLKPLAHRVSQQELNSLYQSVVPNTKKVLDLLQFSDALSSGQANTIRFMKTFIRELDSEMIKLFLRYCTGSDLITKDIEESKIKIDYLHMEENIRGPIAHTCGCVLQLSDNFKSLPQFRSEFSNVLKSGVFIMDIV
ncbi:unnamed protein product [Mytilus coruscus]|uniref:HECT domain-containing protein n=1 Tax=Mytilus coruscus TaxID=42192 RepID=A0A6J8BVW5_MYTCO|nr:unnamed protein product [Mytilus coruscus]